MPLSDKKRNNIKKEAATLSQAFPTIEETLAFQRDYENVIIKLNEKIEARLDEFGAQATPILREGYPARPMGILAVIKEEQDNIRDLSQTLMTHMEKIKYPVFRACAAACIKDLVDICTDSIGEQFRLATIRAGEKLQ
jgi:hypothetical protein